MCFYRKIELDRVFKWSFLLKNQDCIISGRLPQNMKEGRFLLHRLIEKIDSVPVDSEK